MEGKADVIIVGGGIVGLCCAYYVALRGASVTILDKGAMDSGASHVNAGFLVPSHIEPMAAPGVIAQGLKWLSDPESPFYIKPRFDLDLTTWLWGFKAACTRENVTRAVPILRDLALASLDLYDEISALPGFENAGPAQNGLLMLHDSDDGKRHNLELVDVATAADLDARILSRDETLDLEPGIKSALTGSVFFSQDASLDPGYFVTRLQEKVLSMGVRFARHTEVIGFRRAGRSVTHVQTDSEDFRADHVVIAAGSWSGRLAKKLGVKIPLQPATGYSVTVDDPKRSMRIPIILTEKKITIGPMRGKIRFAGTLTLVGFDTKIDPVRLRPIHRQIEMYFEDIKSGSQPMPEAQSGFRPCSTDGLPIIGRLDRAEAGPSNVLIATGHGMLGFTQGPITGKTIADMITGSSTPFDLHEISPARFF